MEVSDLVVSRSNSKVSFSLRRGEILGLAGLQGQGQREILRSLAGVRPRVSGDVTKFDAKSKKLRSLASSAVEVASAGVGFVPEDRKSEGLYLTLSVEQNIALGFLRESSIWRRARVKRSEIVAFVERMSVRASGLAQSVGSLSGGNQQKVMIGRWLASGVDVLLVEEPTRGVDVGAKSEIYLLLRQFADVGGAVLVTSSELTEVLGLCDRILVVRDEMIVADLDGVAATEEEIMRYSLPGAQAVNGVGKGT